MGAISELALADWRISTAVQGRLIQVTKKISSATYIFATFLPFTRHSSSL